MKTGDDGSRRPIPDPTELTTEQLNREILALRDIIETRINAMDTATTLRLVATEKFHDESGPKTEALIQHLREIMETKFDGIDQQFSERDIRTDQAARSSKEALDAALLAAKELVGAQNTANAASAAKAEDNFTKQIDQIGTLIQTQTRATDARITEIKERIDRGAGIGEGVQAQVIERRANTNSLVAIVSVLVAIAGILAGLIIALKA